MLAINTDMRAPKDVNAVSVSISTNGAIKHSFIGRVTPQGEVLLPATLAITEPDDKSATIRIRVMAFQDRKPRVLRDVRTTIPSGGRTALLRIPLNFVNDASAVGDALPDGLVPDPVPGTGGTPTGGTSGGGASSGGGTSGGGASSGGGTSSGGGFGADSFDFFGAFQPPCSDIQNQTIIDGECKDNFVDPESLPDFTGGELGDSTDVGSCFDLAKCFAGASPVGEGQVGGSADAGKDEPRPADASTEPPDVTPDAGTGSGADAGDGGAKFKTLRPGELGLSAVTLDRNTCALQLNGANAARLNLAIVTPDTGECVRPGECYVPIDRGPTGWSDDSGRVQLPRFVCALLNKKNLRLATSTDACEAKLESNPICTPKVGDPVGRSPIDEGGLVGTDGPVRVLAEDYVTSVAAAGSILYFASGSRVGRLDVFNPNDKGSAVDGINVPGSPRRSWRFTNMRFAPGLALTNGTTTGYVITRGGGGGEDQLGTITLGGQAIDATFVMADAPAYLWATTTSVYGSSASTGTAGDLGLPEGVGSATAIFSARGDSIILGESNGNARACLLGGDGCTAPVKIGSGGRIDGFADSPTGSIVYALTQGGIYRLDGDATTPVPQPLALGDTAGIEDAGVYFPRAMAANGACVFYSGRAGLSYARDTGADGSASGTTLVPAAANAPVLGVTSGPMIGSEGGVYYAVNAPSGSGGGVWRLPVPKECSLGSAIPPSSDGGVVQSQCGPGNCAGCCAMNNICQPGLTQTACGNGGSPCQDCVKEGLTCAPPRRGGNGGSCQGQR